ncbi:MAG: hypothetical protein FIB08_17200 [Candidatus Methanoperedens sp.]|nr:hypothetical protein [Candidatus Methanoperedens sp.]
MEFYLEKSPHYSRQSFQYLSDILHGKILYHHIAFIDKIYHIESLWKDEEKEFNKQKNLWKLLCSIGIFNQWKWCAPFNRYLKENSPKFIGSDCVTNEPPKEYMKYFTKNPMILLLRIYSIKRPFSFIYGDLEASDRWDEICKEIERHHIEIEKEVIEDEEFNKIQKHLEETLKECEIDYEIENVDYTCWED